MPNEFVARNGIIALNNSTITGSLNVSGNITTPGTLTVQTIVAQTITSSQSWITGSTKFGSIVSNTHQFTGSILQSGSLAYFAGSVGIGTASPSTKLYVSSSDADYATIIKNTNTSGYGLQVLTAGSSTNLAFQVRTNNTATNAFQVLDNGNVGIGTTSPNGQLHLKGASGITNFGDQVLQIESSTSNYSGIVFSGTNGSNAAIRSEGASTMTFWTATGTSYTERMRITSDGMFGINTTAPVSANLTGSLTIRKVYGADGGSVPSTTATDYWLNQSPLYLFGRNSGLTIIGALNENNEIVFANSATRNFATIGTANGTNSTGGNMYFKTGGNNTRMIIDTSGNIGINTTIAGAYLEITDEDGGQQMARIRNYNVASTGNFTGHYMVELRSAWTTGALSGSLLVHSQEADDTRAVMAISDSNGIFTRFVNGKVGIGSAIPETKLDISGATRITNSSGSGNFLRIRSTTGNYGGQIDFYENSLLSHAIGSTGANNTFYIRDEYNTATRLLINNAGNVGIGTTNPSRKLIVYDTDANTPTIGLRTDGSGTTTTDGFDLQFASSNTFIFNREDGFISFGTNNTEKMRIQANGNVGIGTTNPINKFAVIARNNFGYYNTSTPIAVFQGSNPTLLVANDENTTDAYSEIRLGNAQTTYYTYSPYIRALQGGGIDSYRLEFGTSNFSAATTRMTILSNGNVGIGTNAPSYKLEVTSGSIASIGNEHALYFRRITGTPSDLYSWSADSAAAYLYNHTTSNILIRFNEGGNIGIGTDTPASLLHVNGNATIGYSTATSAPSNGLLVNGSVGIGSTVPGNKLDVAGSISNNSAQNIIYSSYDDVAALFQRVGTYGAIIRLGRFGVTNSTTIDYPADGTFAVSTAGSERMRITSGGNVGIGVTSPTATLDIGSARTLSGTDPISVYTDTRVQSGVTGGLIGYNVRMVGLSPAVGSYTIANMYAIKTNTPVVQPNVTVTNSYGVYIGRTDDPSSGGVVTNKYALVTEATAGNVGIGTTSPVYRLQVNGSTHLGDDLDPTIYGITQITRTGNPSDTRFWLSFIRNGFTISGIAYVTGSNTLGIWNQASNNSGTPTMVWSSGNVGIGTTTPTYILDVFNSTEANLRVKTSSTTGLAGLYIGNGNRDYSIITRNSVSNVLEFRNETANNTVMAISGSNVGIGTTLPDAPLEIYSSNTFNTTTGANAHLIIDYNSGTAGGPAIRFTRVGVSDWSAIQADLSGGTRTLKFIQTNSGVASIQMTINANDGNVGIGTTTPTSKLTVQGTQVELHVKNDATNTLTAGGWDGSRHYIKSINLGIALTPLTLQASSFTFDTGNVGIGTTNPSQKLTVIGGTSLTSIGAGTSATHQILIGADASYAEIQGIVQGTGFDKNLILQRQGGNVGIGTNSPSQDLDMRKTKVGSSVSLRVRNDDNTNGSSHAIVNISNGGPSGGDPIIFFDYGAANNYSIGVDNSDSDLLKISHGASGPGTGDLVVINTSGCVGIGTTNPNYRLRVEGNTFINGMEIGIRNAAATSTDNPQIFFTDGQAGGIRPSEYGHVFIQSRSSAARGVGIITGTTPTERVWVDANGNVGIGYNNPVATLDVTGSSVDFVIPVTAALTTAVPFTINSVGTARNMTGNAGSYTFGDNTMLSLIAGDDVQTHLALWRASDTALGASAGSRLVGFGSRGSMTLPVSVADDDVIFSVEGWAIHGAGPNRAKFGAGMRFVKDDDFGTANTYAPQRTEFYNAVNTTTIQTNMVILPNGNVGIGTTNPGSYKLNVNGQSAFQDNVTINSDKFIFTNNISSNTNFANLAFSGPSSAHIVFTGANVGIGTTSPAYKLEVNGGSVGSNIARFTTGGAGGGTRGMNIYSNDSYVKLQVTDNAGSAASWAHLVLNPDGGNVGIGTTSPAYALDVSGTIRATGDVIAYSDARVKDNVETITDALTKVTSLRGVSYTRKDSEDKSRKLGVIAQEVLDILPEVVQQDDSGNYSVAYGNIVGVLIEAIKELKAEINELKNNK